MALLTLNNNLLLYCYLYNKNNNVYYTNKIKNYSKNYYISLLIFSEYVNKKIIFKELYQLYNIQYLQKIYNIKLKEKNINAINILPKKMSKYILFKTRYKSFKSFKIKYFNEVVYLFLINIFLKNSKNICKFIKKKLENVHFKRHRKYFLFFFKILNSYIKTNFRLLNIHGLLLQFKGKLGRGGNSRTKTMRYKLGQISLGNKGLCINSNKWGVWTKTGSFSCTFQIFYK